MNDFAELLAEYPDVLESVKKILAFGCLRAALDGNQAITETYYEIGREIDALLLKHGCVEEEDEDEVVDYSCYETDEDRVCALLALDLHVESSGVGGLSASDFHAMRCLSYWTPGIGQQPVAQLPWDMLKSVLDFPTEMTPESFADFINGLLTDPKAPLGYYYPPAGTSPSLTVIRGERG